MPFLFIFAFFVLIFLAVLRARKSRTVTNSGSTVARASKATVQQVGELRQLAMIASTAFADSIHKPLDFTDASIERLDPLLPPIGLMKDADGQMAPPNVQIRERILVLGSYVGEVLIRHHHGAWNIDPAVHPLPFIEFSGGLRASPFDLLQSEANAGGRKVAELYADLLSELSGSASTNSSASSHDGVQIPDTVAVAEPPTIEQPE